MIRDYALKRSNRRSISLSIQKDGMLLVKAPFHISRKDIESFIVSKNRWITRAKDKHADCIILKETDKYTYPVLCEITTKRIDAFIKGFSGRHPSSIRVRRRKSVWGTCNNRGVITINSFAGFLPDDLFEYIMIHELTHLEVLNHNDYFWNLVSYHIPDWKEKRSKLRRYRIEI